VPDFTSALYLGFGHPSASLRPWDRLTTGTPAALRAPPGSPAVADALARLQGCERASLAPSTLHLFWDLFAILAGSDDAIYVDARAYPIGRWGVDRAVARGIRTVEFPHRRPDTLERRVQRDRHRPLVLVDGLCPDCGRAAPLSEYVRIVEPRGGLVVVDDTQALGIIGADPGPTAPYGRGGGGSLRWHGLRSTAVVVATSLAKGLGVPLASLAGPARLIERFEHQSATRWHCSPPSLATLRAAERALALNDAHGDRLRARLAELVRRFRSGLAALGLVADGGRFPIQTLVSDDATGVHTRLLDLGVQAVLRSADGSARLSFLITALHDTADIDLVLEALDRTSREAGGHQARRLG
jgi:8-amino-7-oxononanoate synthase